LVKRGRGSAEASASVALSVARETAGRQPLEELLIVYARPRRLLATPDRDRAPVRRSTTIRRWKWRVLDFRCSSSDAEFEALITRRQAARYGRAASSSRNADGNGARRRRSRVSTHASATFATGSNDADSKLGDGDTG
jgi:hypothetical protein